MGKTSERRDDRVASGLGGGDGEGVCSGKPAGNGRRMMMCWAWLFSRQVAEEAGEGERKGIETGRE